MPYFRCDDQLAHHQRADKLKARCGKSEARLAMAWMVWLHMGCDCMSRLTDGHFTYERARRVVQIGASSLKKALGDLVFSGYLVEVEGGYLYHDWLQYQYSAERVKRERENTRMRVQKHRGNGVTPDGGNGVTPTVTNGATNGVGNPHPIQSNPIQSTKNPDGGTDTVTNAGAGTTPRATPDDGEFERVCGIVAAASGGAVQLHRVAAVDLAALKGEVRRWSYADEHWRAFGEACRTRQGRDALWPWAKAKVATGVSVPFLAGRKVQTPEGRLIASWEPLLEALARETADLRSAGTDGAFSGQRGAYRAPLDYWQSADGKAAGSEAMRRVNALRDSGQVPRDKSWVHYWPEEIDRMEREATPPRPPPLRAVSG